MRAGAHSPRGMMRPAWLGTVPLDDQAEAVREWEAEAARLQAGGMSFADARAEAAQVVGRRWMAGRAEPRS